MHFENNASVLCLFFARFTTVPLTIRELKFKTAAKCVAQRDDVGDS